MIAVATPVRAAARVPLRPAYVSGTHCPACASQAWHVGRFSAECARCGEALPFAPEARADR